MLPRQRQTRSTRRGERLILQQSLHRRSGERHTVSRPAALDADNFAFIVELHRCAEHLVEDIVIDHDHRQDGRCQRQRIHSKAQNMGAQLAFLPCRTQPLIQRPPFVIDCRAAAAVVLW